MSIDVYLSLLLKLAAGVFAIQAPQVPLSLEKAAAYGVAASYHGLRAGVDPFELIAIARNETDFVENLSGPDGKDCGLTQTRVTITRYSCRQLKRSYWLAFQEAARELSEYGKACKGKPDFDRCRLNHYNSGVKYAKRGVHGEYYLRVQCFAAAARAGVDPGKGCRTIHSRRDIARVLKRATPRAPVRMVATADPRPNT